MLIESVEENNRLMRLRQLTDDYYSRIELQKNYMSILNENDNVLYVDLDQIRSEYPLLWDEIIAKPMEMSKVFESVAMDKIKESMVLDGEDPDYFDGLRIAFTGNLGKHTVTPRGLKSTVMHKLVKLQGIVTSTTKVKFRLLKSTHYCELTKKTLQKEYKDAFSMRMNEEKNDLLTNQIPTHDPNGNPLMFEHGLSHYKNVQYAIIQEMPEDVPSGLLSRSVDVLLQEDLVDKVKPGERVQIIGIPRPTATSHTMSNCVFKVTLLAISVKKLRSIEEEQELSPQERKDIREIAQRKDLLPLFRRSMAPAIAGHDHVKEALLLLLLGGTEKILENGTKLRGDINVLLVGDPSTAKSQFLRRVLNLATLGFNTTGRGSTGVGLTAAITMDRDTGEKTLEAGAMVLADRGVICVDEFDKMSDEDRVTMHEAMEQQTVTISKAGINISLNARCSVLAAANPIYSEYDNSKSVSYNIGLRDSLLSRFDLIFIILDEKNPQKDRMIAERVTANHRFHGNSLGLQHSNDITGVIEAELIETDKEHVKPFEQFNAMLHLDKNIEYLSQPFLKKYLSFAKFKKPVLTDEARKLIVQKWCRLRELDTARDKKKIAKIRPIDVRTLDSIIRLATAYSKFRLSDRVETPDCINALNIFINVYYGGYKNFDPEFFADQPSYCIDPEFGCIAIGFKETAKQARSKKRNVMEIEQTKQEEPIPKSSRRTKQRTDEITGEGVASLSSNMINKKKILFNIMYELQQSTGKSSIVINELKEYISENYPNADKPNVKFTNKEIDTLAQVLSDESKLVIDESTGMYFLI